MQLKRGDMLAQLVPGQVVLVTTNSYVRKDGALVMGRGAALQMARMFPQIPLLFGSRIEHLGEYNIGVLSNSTLSLGAFQVKRHFGSRADLSLIENSTAKLHDLACSDDRIFNVNFPGIGNGRLKYKQVLPILESLPDNVNVWTF